MTTVIEGSPYRGRFAPSPTGALHLGSLVAALGSWLRARCENGSWIVRIEDLDPPREVAGAALQQISTLAAFGLVSDEPILWQHQRAEAYGNALATLRQRDVAFACWCSRSDLAPSHGIHRSPCRGRKTNSRAPAWRVRVPDEEIAFVDGLAGHYAQNLRRDIGDFVVQRVEGYFAYQLAVVVDDAFQHITEVVRGADLLDSTPRQLWLQRALGYAPPAYVHLPLILGPDGRKLSKHDRARPVDSDDPLPALRAALEFLGIPAQALRGLNTVDGVLHCAKEQFLIDRVPRPVADVHLHHGMS